MKFYVECPIAGSISGEVEAESEDKALEALQEMHAADEASCEVEWEWMEPARHRTDAAPSEAAFEELGPAALGAWIAKCTLSKAHTSLAAEILGRVTAGRRCPGVVALLRGLLGRVDSPLVREGAIYGLSYHRDSAIDATLRRLAADDASPGVREAAAEILDAGAGAVSAPRRYCWRVGGPVRAADGEPCPECGTVGERVLDERQCGEWTPHAPCEWPVGHPGPHATAVIDDP